MRLKKKVVNLINDLVLNDDGIYEEHPYTVRQHFCGNQASLEKLNAILTSADLESMQELQYRDQILRIVFRLHQYKPAEVGAVLLETLNGHKARIEGLLSNPNADQDLKDMLRDEL